MGFMKVLISNYASEQSTEPLYFNATLNAIGCQSTLRPPNVSTFDIFDIIQPDLYITHHSQLTQDIPIYLSNNSNKIALAINITGLNQNQLKELENAFDNFNITPSLFFVNYCNHNLQSRKTNIVNIPYGADIFLNTEQNQYSIQYGIFVDHKDQIKPIGQTYHYITNNNKLNNVADIFLSVDKLTHLYHNYDHIVYRYFNNVLDQSFFDASYRNLSVLFDIEDRTELKAVLGKLLDNENICDINDINSGNIRDKILQKHTGLHRTKSLVSQLLPKKYVDDIQTFIDKVMK